MSSCRFLSIAEEQRLVVHVFSGKNKAVFQGVKKKDVEEGRFERYKKKPLSDDRGLVVITFLLF